MIEHKSNSTTGMPVSQNQSNMPNEAMKHNTAGKKLDAYNPPNTKTYIPSDNSTLQKKKV